METTLRIKGMHCASCVTKIERSLQHVSGVKKATINLATESAFISHDPAQAPIARLEQAIRVVGYQVERTADVRDRHVHHFEELHHLQVKLGVGILLTFIVLLGSFPHFFPFLPAITHHPYLLFVLATIVQFYVGWQFYRGFFSALRHFSSDMNTLIAIGTSAAYFYSVIATFFPHWFTLTTPDLYYDTSSAIITLIILGRYLEAIAKRKTSDAVTKLLDLSPKIVTVVRHHQEIRLPLADLAAGDVFVVKPGETIATDGVIFKGTSSVDESLVTGESLPVEKTIGSSVYGGTLNQQGVLYIKATKVGKQTLLAQIVRMVEEAQGSKAPIQRLADKISGIFVPVVVLLSVATFFLWLFLGPSPSFNLALLSFVSILIVSCPCALGLATPTAIMVGIGKGAQQGIFIKGGDVLERVRSLTTFVFDKTGTLTQGKPRVTDVVSLSHEKDLLKYASIAEKNSGHPLAEAVLTYAAQKNVSVTDAYMTMILPGKGVKARHMNKTIYLGNRRLLDEAHIPYDQLLDKITALESEGKTVMLLGVNKECYGLIAVADTLKESSADVVRTLKQMGKEVILLTGDNEATARALGNRIGISQVIAKVLPDQKVAVIKQLQRSGKKVAMVGDGINDSPSLAQADVGIALGSGADIAKETGNIVLVKNDLRDVLKAVQLSLYTLRKIKQNLFWAFIYNVLSIPLAAGIFYPVNGFLLNPMIAAGAMSLSSLSVVLNSLSMKAHQL